MPHHRPQLPDAAALGRTRDRLAHGWFVLKMSGVVPALLAGGAVGGLGAAGAQRWQDAEYGESGQARQAGVRGALLGAGVAGGAYALSRLPPWMVLPMTALGGLSLAHQLDKDSPDPQPLQPPAPRVRFG